MRTRLVALSALAVMVALGVVGMHALGMGHGPAKRTMPGMALDRAMPVSTTSVGASSQPDSTGEGHTNALMTLCVAILSVGLAVAASALAKRALARERRPQAQLHLRGGIATRMFPGHPPPLLAPLRT